LFLCFEREIKPGELIINYVFLFLPANFCAMLIRFYVLIMLCVLPISVLSQQFGVEYGGFTSTDHMTHTGNGITKGVRLILGNGVLYDLNIGARMASISFIDQYAIQEKSRFVGWETLTIPSSSVHVFVSSRIYMAPINKYSFFLEPEIGIAKYTSEANIKRTKLNDELVSETGFEEYNSGFFPTLSIIAGIRYYLTKHITLGVQTGILGYNYSRSVNELEVNWHRKLDIKSYLFSLQAGVYINIQENFYKETRCNGGRARLR